MQRKLTKTGCSNQNGCLPFHLSARVMLTEVNYDWFTHLRASKSTKQVILSHVYKSPVMLDFHSMLMFKLFKISTFAPKLTCSKG